MLCGASFGCRVLAEALRENVAQLPARVAPALICCGYPLNKKGEADGADQKRPNHLRKLPAANRVLLVQGTKDEFNGSGGMQNMRDLREQMAAPSQVALYEVPGGAHSVPQATPKKEQQQVTAAVCARIVQFVEDFL